MSWALEIAATGDAKFAAGLCAWLHRDALRVLLSLRGVIHVDIYSPAAGGAHDPFVAAAVGPLVDALAEHAARLRAEGALPPPRKKSRRR